MNHLHMRYDDVLNTPLLTVSLLISESTPDYSRESKKKKDGDIVEMDTYEGRVKAKRKFII